MGPKRQRACSANIVREETVPEKMIPYFYINEKGTPMINVNIKSIRYPDSFVYEVVPDREEMSGQFTQVQVYPDHDVVKFFIEQTGGIAIFIKPKNITDKVDHFVERTDSFSGKNGFSQENINEISRSFLKSLLSKLQNKEYKNVISRMSNSREFMMTIVEGMVSLDDVLCNQNQFGDSIVSLTLKPESSAAAPTTAAAAPTTAAAATDSERKIKGRKRGTERGTERGGKSKRNKSKKGTKRRNKKDKRKTRKYKK
jgi:hypothetical protein